jgi:hypothetical protein
MIRSRLQSLTAGGKQERIDDNLCLDEEYLYVVDLKRGDLIAVFYNYKSSEITITTKLPRDSCYVNASCVHFFGSSLATSS